MLNQRVYELVNCVTICDIINPCANTMNCGGLCFKTNLMSLFIAQKVFFVSLGKLKYGVHCTYAGPETAKVTEN